MGLTVYHRSISNRITNPEGHGFLQVYVNGIGMQAFSDKARTIFNEQLQQTSTSNQVLALPVASSSKARNCI